MTELSTRIAAVRNQIAAACSEAGRSPHDIGLLAVSKTQPAKAIEQANRAGQEHFGENYLQDALPKVAAYPSVTWHFIGAIQSNKTREIANNFGWVHSVASTKVARRLSDQRDEALPALNLLLQVNLSGEDSKSGLSPEALSGVIESCLTLPQIRLRGLMTIPEATQDEQILKQRFSDLRALKLQLEADYELPEFNHLSMGMSSDFKIAINEGATWIRIGTAIFGPRVGTDK